MNEIEKETNKRLIERINALKAQLTVYNSVGFSDADALAAKFIDLTTERDALRQQVAQLSEEKRQIIATAIDNEAQLDALRASNARLREALTGLLADVEEYQAINHLGGENNHWQVQARAALAEKEQEL